MTSIFSRKIWQHQVGRRNFLKWGAAAIGSGALAAWMLFPWGKKNMAQSVFTPKPPGDREKLIFVAIDALNPKYLDLDANGNTGGKNGNWLMPNVRAFLDKALWYQNAKAYLPAATDMNHLNALAGTSTAQTGIIGVWAQPVSWKNGDAVIKNIHLSLAADEQGQPVDTLFHAWKRRWPDSKTLLITGKEWVGEMFRMDSTNQIVDILATGPDHPDYLSPPKKEEFADPHTDDDADCDPESGRLGLFAGKMDPSSFMTRCYTGQKSFLTFQMEHFANHFPHDSWIVDSTLEIFRREDPDLAYILMAQCDDAGHCIGNAADPSEFQQTELPYKAPRGCKSKPGYQMVSRRNPLLFKEACLDVIRDVDIQFGKLMNGLEEQGVLARAKIILLSDHSAVNHLSSDTFSSTDVMGILKDAGIDDDHIYAFSVSSYGNLYWRNKKEEIPRVKKLLQAHRALNPETGKNECPWWVLDRKDMKEGVEGICLPGELYHSYFIEKDREKTMIWPDIIILAKNGWQIPVYNGHIPNVGIKAPRWAPPWRVYNGGHGSIDTLPIVAAISVPGGKSGISEEAIRIGDLGVTAAALFGLNLRSTRVGIDRSRDLLRA